MPRDPLPPADPDRPPVLVRAAGYGDAGHLVRMIRRLAQDDGNGPSPGLFDVEWDVLGADTWAAAFVAEAGGKPVGCALAGRHYRAAFGERCLDLGSLVVEPAWRGRGVGRALVAAVLRRAEELACSRVMVGTTTGNTSAQRFYQRLGFEPAPLPGPRYRMLISPELRPA